MMSYWATRRGWSLAILYMNHNFWYIKKDRKIIKLILISSWSGLRLKERASEKGVWKLPLIFLSDYTAWDAFDWLTVEKSLRHNAFTNSGKNIDYSLAIYSILGIPEFRWKTWSWLFLSFPHSCLKCFSVLYPGLTFHLKVGRLT